MIKTSLLSREGVETQLHGNRVGLLEGKKVLGLDAQASGRRRGHAAATLVALFTMQVEICRVLAVDGYRAEGAAIHNGL